MTAKINIPQNGKKITIIDNKLSVPNNPIIPFIEGDGIGPDIWRSSVRVFDKAVEKAYSNNRKIEWLEIYAGEKANIIYGENIWLPQETLDVINEYLIAIKGPLTTPIGGGIRSINVALRQKLDLYVCLRPVKWFNNVPTPVKNPELINMIIFRENTEDIYAGIEFLSNTKELNNLLNFLKTNFIDEYKKIRFPESCSIGLKPISKEGSQRLIKAAIDWAWEDASTTRTIGQPVFSANDAVDPFLA